ncbi:MAG: hypothetical protein QG597_3117, partial [Actinomycetota bacterium]|nr:hypothetical protein [Actinomycetota bacterium]
LTFTRKPDWVRVSLDACTPQTYARLKQADFFGTVVRNLGEYRTLGLDFLGIGFTVTKHNVADIPLLPKFLRDNRLDDGEVFVQFKFLRGYPDMLPGQPDLIEAVTGLSTNARLLGLESFFAQRTNLSNLPTFFSDRTHLRPTVPRCHYSMIYLLVKANGDAYPCGSMAFRSLNRLGNVNEVDIDFIVENARRFHGTNVPVSNADCVGCWDDHINVAMQQLLENGLGHDPGDELLFPYPFSRFWG